MTAIKNCNENDFEDEVLKSKLPVIVDFWAEWCGPCKAIGPALDEMSDEMGDRVKIVKINIDENPATPQQFGVRGIPTMLIFNGGEIKAEKIGALPKSKLSEWIEESI